jgi:hypothetical protein
MLNKIQLLSSFSEFHMATVLPDLTPIECEAMAWLNRAGGLLLTAVPDKSDTDVIGSRTPGRPTFARLEKKGLCFLTEEDRMFPDEPENMETWTPTFELTDAGRAWVKDHNH